MIHDILIPPATRTLGALSGILTKADAHCAARKIDPAVLLTYRLYPDMLNFTKQVQLACDFAARAASRLVGEEVPSFPDTETSFAELQARIAAVRAHLASFGPERFSDAATRTITLKLRQGELVLPGLQFLTLYALPQVYFHAVTAYDILRHNGVEIGKSDFMGV
jgi:uncharacterized protein